MLSSAHAMKAGRPISVTLPLLPDIPAITREISGDASEGGISGGWYTQDAINYINR